MPAERTSRSINAALMLLEAAAADRGRLAVIDGESTWRYGDLAPAPVFHHQGYFRIALTGSERMLERAIPVLARFSPG